MNNFRNKEFDKFRKIDSVYKLDFNLFRNEILVYILSKYYTFISEKFNKLYDKILKFSSYYNEKYYQAGFAYYLNLIIMSLGGNKIHMP